MSVTLKLATSLDGRIATGSGESRWITGPEAREQGHRLRAIHQLILVGVETAIADDPELTVRLPSYMGAQPTRVVLDSRQRLPLSSRLASTARETPTVVVTTTEPRLDLTQAGVQVLRVAEAGGRVDVQAALEALAGHDAGSGPADLLIEGGGQVAASFLQAGAVDRIEWFRAPILLGEKGRPGVGTLQMDALTEAPRFRRTHVQALGDDLWERYERT